MSSQSEIDRKNREETIDIFITSGDFTNAADEYEKFELESPKEAKEFFNSLSVADASLLRVALDQS